MTKFLAESGLKRVWAKFKNYLATTSRAGLMSAADKKKLDGIGKKTQSFTFTYNYIVDVSDKTLYYVVVAYEYETETGEIFTGDTAIVDTSTGSTLQPSFNVFGITCSTNDDGTGSISIDDSLVCGTEATVTIFKICDLS